VADDEAYDRLAELDPAMAALIGRLGRPDPFSFSPILNRIGDDRFRALMLSITSQQIDAPAGHPPGRGPRDPQGGAAGLAAPGGPVDQRRAGAGARVVALPHVRGGPALELTAGGE
jgi:hypothetical protein